LDDIERNSLFPRDGKHNQRNHSLLPRRINSLHLEQSITSSWRVYLSKRRRIPLALSLLPLETLVSAPPLRFPRSNSELLRRRSDPSLDPHRFLPFRRGFPGSLFSSPRNSSADSLPLPRLLSLLVGGS
jgi:hypothetical protein